MTNNVDSMFGLAFGVLGAGIALKYTDDMIKELNKNGKKAKKRNRKCKC